MTVTNTSASAAMNDKEPQLRVLTDQELQEIGGGSLIDIVKQAGALIDKLLPVIAPEIHLR
jgi:hypothetical protein